MIKRYLPFLVADFLISFASGLSFLGVNWYVIFTFGENRLVGYSVILFLLPAVLLYRLVGRYSDRIDRRKLVLLSAFSRFGLLLAVAATLEYRAAWIILAYAFATGCFWTLYQTASRAMIQDFSLDEPRKLIALREGLMQLAMFGTAGLSGVIIHVLGFQTLVLVSGTLFGLGGLLFLMVAQNVPKTAILHSKENKAPSGRGVIGPEVFLVLLLALPMVVVMGFNAILPGFVSFYLEKGAVFYTMSDMVYGFGAFFVGVLLSRTTQGQDMEHLVWPIGIALCLVLISLPFLSHAGIILAFFLLFGAFNSSLKIVFHTLAMRKVGSDRIGRVMAAVHGVAGVVQIVTIISISNLFEGGDIRFGFFVLAAVVAMCTALFLIQRRSIGRSGPLGSML